MSVEAGAASDRGRDAAAGSVGGCDRAPAWGERQPGVPLAQALSLGTAGGGAGGGATGAGADQEAPG
jgi:hypothetical protein